MDERENFLNEVVATGERARAGKKTQFLVLLLIGIACLILAVVFFVLSFGNLDLMALFYVGIVCFVLGVGLMVGAFLSKSSFTKRIRKNLSAYVDTHVFKDVENLPDGRFSEQELLSTGFYMPPDRYLGSDWKSASYKGIRFSQASYTLQHRQVRSDGKHTYVEYITYAMGTLYKFTFERQLPGAIWCIERGGGLYGINLKKRETEFIAFNRKFDSYTTDEQTFFYILTPQVQEDIMAMEQSLKGQFSMAFINGNNLYVGVNDSFSSVDVSLFKPFTRKEAERILKVLAFPTMVIDELKLDGNKYKKNAGV